MLIGGCEKSMANKGQREGLSVKAGRWYACVYCPSCLQVIPVREVEEGALAEHLPQGLFQGVRCPTCDVVSDHHSKEPQCVRARAKGRLR